MVCKETNQMSKLHFHISISFQTRWHHGIYLNFILQKKRGQNPINNDGILVELKVGKIKDFQENMSFHTTDALSKQCTMHNMLQAFTLKHRWNPNEN